MAINPFDIMKNLKEMQQSFGSMQEKIKEVTATGTAGGDMVKIEINGSFEVLNIFISPDVVNPQDIKMLEDLILAAFTQAMNNIKEKIKETFSPLTENMHLPPGFMGL